MAVLVSYTNPVKMANGVDGEILGRFGAISRETARAMAEACRNLNKADLGVGITGSAGPDPSEGKDPGTVFLGISTKHGTRSVDLNLPGIRVLVKQRAAHRCPLRASKGTSNPVMAYRTPERSPNES